MSQANFALSGHIVDVVQGKIFPGTIQVANGRIITIEPCNNSNLQGYILPGFIDAHVHVESSMLAPGEFARAAMAHGVIGSVSDPHEIANVLGLKGVRAMIADGRKTLFHFAFGAPACVPATSLETSGAHLGADAVEELFDTDGLTYLSEVMNVPGVLNGDEEVMAKLAAAKKRGLKIDGHAPGLRGDALRRYMAAGPTTDHEMLSLNEAREKAALGMKILIRRGSAADMLDSLIPLLIEFPDACMFCSDDLHPDDLMRGHINDMVKHCIRADVPAMTAIRAASFNPACHYGLNNGLLQPGDPADFIIVDNLHDLAVRQTWLRGRLVAENGHCLLPCRAMSPVNRFDATARAATDFAVPFVSGNINVIVAQDSTLATERLSMRPCLQNGQVTQDTSRDLLKLVIVNRYAPDTPPAVAFIHGFGLKHGALASSVAHDSHHLLAVGVSDAALAQAVNAVIAHRGGLAVCSEHATHVLPLPIAGLMSGHTCAETAARYLELDTQARMLGCPLRAPFMTLSFMALLVIPKLKLGDRGLFDSEIFRFIPLFDSEQS